MPRKLWLVLSLGLLGAACGGGQVIDVEAPPPVTVETATAPAPTLSGDKRRLQELVERAVVNDAEVVGLSNRMLQEDIARGLDDQTLANLEKALLKALPTCGKNSQAVIQRNLGIVHFYRKEYGKARQALQSANETNPRDARTHFYLACIYHREAQRYQRKGQVTKAKRAEKRAQIELETARRLEPENPLYRKNPGVVGE